jgi:hypothetical protein
VKHKIVLLVGVLAGLIASDYVIGMLGVEVAAGIGMDDFVRAVVITAVVLIVDSLI